MAGWYQRAKQCAAITALAIGIGAPASSETLREAMVSAYKESGLLEQNRALLRAADEDVAVAAAALRPIIGYTASLSRDFGDSATQGRFTSHESSAGLSADLLLFDGGSSRLNTEAQKEVVLATRESLRALEQEVILRGVVAYMDVRLRQAVVSLRENNLRLITQELRAARDRFEVGEVTRTDVALAESRLAASRSQLAAAQGDYVRAQEEYANVIGHQPGTLAPVSPANTGVSSVAEAKAIARRTHPELEAAKHEITAAEINVARAQAALKPSLNLEGRYGITRDLDTGDEGRSGSVGLNLSGPIYRGGELSARTRQATARRDAERASLITVQRNVDQEVGNAFATLSVVRASREASVEQVRAAQVAFEGLREEATLGARTTLEVLDAEQELLDARFELVSSEVDQIISSYQLLAAMGRLTVDALNLPVQRYDPAAYYNLVKDAPVAVSRQGRALDRVLKSLNPN
ncbi:outer membrane protein [Poseidonocella pacifica]|uniref:Outer membrane protein n=1 Tax=Poseidonocella pacifica TaxID=871651 RepID=A0A1I0V6J3_9RHOB|nr:TolC family outer membrane protein [Poseidonocella pacifica]SFA71949.1 outer membrane protein [Poseidonocella pacifica]